MVIYPFCEAMKKKKYVWFALILTSVFLIFWYLISLKTEGQDFESQYVSYSSTEKPVKIAVATDLHYLSSKLTDKGTFFSNIVDNADGKNMYYIEEITESFVETIIDEKPEILILSGDLTFNGEKESHLDLEKKLNRIQENGTQILVIPGNHDIDRSSAASFYGEEYQLVNSISKDEFAQIYQKYGLQESLQKDDSSLSYIYKARNDFWILMLDSNSNQVNRISDETIIWAENVLKEAQAKNIKVLGVSHQNILTHNPYFREGFVIGRAGQIEKLYIKYGVIGNISGHIHIQHFDNSTLPEILTSALPVSPHHYGMIVFDRETLTYEAQALRVEDWAREKGLLDDNLLNFSTHSRQFMEEVALRKVDADFVDSKLTVEERQLLLDTFAKLNTNYFAGHQINEPDYQAGIYLWREKGLGFYVKYIETILDSTKKDYGRLVLNIE